MKCAPPENNHGGFSNIVSRQRVKLYKSGNSQTSRDISHILNMPFVIISGN